MNTDNDMNKMRLSKLRDRTSSDRILTREKSIIGMN